MVGRVPSGKRTAAADRRKVRVEFQGEDRRLGFDRRVFPYVHGAHRLEPAGPFGWIPNATVVFHLQNEFAFLETDEELGLLHLKRVVRYLEYLQREEFSAQRGQQILQLSEKIPGAVYARFGDNPTSETEFLDTVIIRATPLVCSYGSDAQRDASHPLLQRCARVLQYKIVSLVDDDLGFWPSVV